MNINGYRLAPEAADALRDLLDDAKKAGYRSLHIQSAYRSYDTQKSLYWNKVARMRSTYGREAPEAAAMWVARPGTSEHQTGLAVDITTNGKLSQSFGKTAAGIWMAENAHLYGFILRYPADKVDITGIHYEPWHFRYVGKRHARTMVENDWCLEEYRENIDRADA